MPERIRRQRTGGWRKDANTVCCDRTSILGNPFTVADAIEAGYENPRRAAVSHYEAWLEGHASYQDEYQCGRRTYSRVRILAELPRLRGRDLACYCSLDEEWCHVDVLLRLANQEMQPA